MMIMKICVQLSSQTASQQFQLSALKLLTSDERMVVRVVPAFPDVLRDVIPGFACLAMYPERIVDRHFPADRIDAGNHDEVALRVEDAVLPTGDHWSMRLQSGVQRCDVIESHRHVYVLEAVIGHDLLAEGRVETERFAENGFCAMRLCAVAGSFGFRTGLRRLDHLDTGVPAVIGLRLRFLKRNREIDLHSDVMFYSSRQT